MTRDTHSYEPRLGHGLPHDPFNAIVGPRPIGWISTRSADGVLNLAPYSFFNAFNYVPPIIGFASIGAKDTLRNIEATGEFVWNLATRPLAEAMNQSCAAVGPEVDEFALAGLTPLASTRVAPPRVAESPVTMECRRTQVLQLTGADGQAVPTWLVLGEVVAVHIDRTLLTNGLYDTAAAQPVLRGGGAGDYFMLGERFQMFRPGL
ncbi:flavin reductase family protein [Acidovorax lacteus]|uniref:Flavin reductase family protein n=1 Tax=Acidovorax lacteus TaxID=1924988 RepID=A0ABP8LLB9_9BURK